MSRKAKFSYSDKLEAVLKIISGHVSIRQTSREMCIDHKEIRRWVSLYTHHGREGLLSSSKTYSTEFKVGIIRDMEKNHLSLFSTSVKFKVSVASILHWKQILETQGVVGFYANKVVCMKIKPEKVASEKTRDELLEELEKLRMENAYLKKLQTLVQERIAREKGNGPKPSRS